jgi:hypothetical protein
MKKQYHEALTELKSLHLINKLLLQEISEIEALEVTYIMKSIQCNEKSDSGQTSENCDIEQASDKWIPVVSNKRTNVHMMSLIRRKQLTICMHNNFTVIAQHEDSTSCKDNNIISQNVNSTLC